MKLSKRDLKKQKEIIKLLEKEKLTDDEVEQFYTEFNEAFLGDITQGSAYFTGLPLAYDFTLMVPTGGVLVDMCAGIGVLTFAAHCRDHHEKRTSKYICIEQNTKYIEIGKKLCPFAIWYQGDIFDKSLWDRIKKEHGPIDCIISNPPFGSISQTNTDKSWLSYTGKEIDIAAIEIAIKNSEYQSFILPQGSCTFRASGRYQYGGAEHVENRKIAKLKKDMGAEFYMGWASIDTSYYEQNFKNTNITVECLTIMDLEFINTNKKTTNCSQT